MVRSAAGALLRDVSFRGLPQYEFALLECIFVCQGISAWLLCCHCFFVAVDSKGALVFRADLVLVLGVLS